MLCGTGRSFPGIAILHCKRSHPKLEEVVAVFYHFIIKCHIRLGVSALIRGNFKPKNAKTGIQPHKYQMSINAKFYRLLMHTMMHYYFFTMSQSLILLNLNLFRCKNTSLVLPFLHVYRIGMCVMLISDYRKHRYIVDFTS